jgi:hypothetical protein
MSARRDVLVTTLLVLWAVPAKSASSEGVSGWGKLARASSAVVTARAEVPGMRVIRPEKKVEKIVTRSDGARIVHLPDESEYLVGYVTRFRVEAVHASKGGARVGEGIDVFCPPAAWRLYVAGERYLLFLTRPPRLDAEQTQEFGDWQGLYGLMVEPNPASGLPVEAFQPASALSITPRPRVRTDIPTVIGYTDENLTKIEAALSEVRVATDRSQPSVQLAAPAPDAVLKETVEVVIESADNDGVAEVGLLIDGVPVAGPLTQPPYRSTWDTRSVADGPHVMAAVARDVSWNETISAPVAVTVANSPQPNQPPTVSVSLSRAACHPTPSNPCTATCTASASDPDGDPLTYAWSGGASGSGATATCSVPDLATHACTVSVSDGRGGTAQAVAWVTGTNTAPGCVANGGYPLTVYHLGWTDQIALAITDADGDAIAGCSRLASDASFRIGIGSYQDCGSQAPLFRFRPSCADAPTTANVRVYVSDGWSEASCSFPIECLPE